jgi:hypothetical protein
MQEEKGKTSAPGQAGIATLTMPDGTTVELPVLLDSNGDKFVDIRKLQPRWVGRVRGGLAPGSCGSCQGRAALPPPPHPLRCASKTSRLASHPCCSGCCSTGMCTFDPGFGSTASCESKITFIDGNKGVLLYRG